MTEEHAIPASKEEIKTWIKEGRARFAGHWAGLTKEQMLAVPGATPEWSVKDLIAHIIWWENFSISRMLLIAVGKEAPVFTEWDAINERVRRAHETLTLEELLADWNHNEAKVLAATDGFTFEELMGELQYRDGPLGALLAGNTYGHYEEHEPDLIVYVQSRGNE
jgi:hypothetical protein